MIGSHPTVQVPPWDLFDDPTADMTSPFPVSGVVNFNGNATSPNGGDYNPFMLGEALTALQRFLPSNEFANESDDSDAPMDSFTCDNFRMFEFKVRRCARGRSHDWTECPYAHPARRLAAVTRGSIITQARRVLSFARGLVRRVTRASLLMVFSSVGFTRRGTGLRPVRMGRTVAGESVSSLTRRNSSEFCLSRVRELRTRPSRMMGRRQFVGLLIPTFRMGHLGLLRLRF
ncbi:hypothetical protein L1049_018282 [Liquidambar formosana]|uniref:AtC3H23-like CCCH zinc finger domain-containing protein n=1 Tax=Liquidambar formosana TaxID=63359 RepID=A0AAP0WLG3_LIQFO